MIPAAALVVGVVLLLTGIGGDDTGDAAAAPTSGVVTSTRPVGPSRASTRSWATSRPRSTIAALVQTSSTSASRWLDRNTVVPPATSSTSRSRTSRMPCGSSPLVGSSRTSSRGARSRAAASPRR